MDKKSKFLKWVLAAGIVVVLNLLFAYSIQLIYESPNIEDYCIDEQVNVIPKTQEECLGVGGQWTEGIKSIPLRNAEGIAIPDDTYCNTRYTCEKEFDAIHDVYNRNVFIVHVILGVISIAVSFAFISFEAVSLGLSLGGVLSFIVGSIRYWSAAPDYIKVIILGIALAALIYLGIKKVKD